MKYNLSLGSRQKASTPAEAEAKRKHKQRGDDLTFNSIAPAPESKIDCKLCKAARGAMAQTTRRLPLLLPIPQVCEVAVCPGTLGPPSPHSQILSVQQSLGQALLLELLSEAAARRIK